MLKNTLFLLKLFILPDGIKQENCLHRYGKNGTERSKFITDLMTLVAGVLELRCYNIGDIIRLIYLCYLPTESIIGQII